MKIRTPWLVLCLIAAACGPADDEASTDDTADITRVPAPGVVEVIARDLTLIAPDTVPPGWTTFRFVNTSPMAHFAIVQRVPEGHGLASHQAEIAPVFQEGYDLLAAGDADAAMAAFGTLPPWFGEVVFMGGPGMTSAGRTSEATVQLEPGTYLLECYVKTDGRFHSFNPEGIGMVHEFVVTGPATEAPEPTADVRITISSETGITVDGEVTAGRRTVAVDFADQTVHENFVGHDVHVVRLDDGVSTEQVETWMDWTRPGALETPAPAPFLGGTNEMPAGSTGYFTVDFEPGSHAWVAEVPGAADKGMLVRFDVGPGS
jgi:hypothetical protein